MFANTSTIVRSYKNQFFPIASTPSFKKSELSSLLYISKDKEYTNYKYFSKCLNNCLFKSMICSSKKATPDSQVCTKKSD